MFCVLLPLPNGNKTQTAQTICVFLGCTICSMILLVFSELSIPATREAPSHRHNNHINQLWPLWCWIYFRKWYTYIAFLSFHNIGMARVPKAVPRWRQQTFFPTQGSVCFNVTPKTFLQVVLVIISYALFFLSTHHAFSLTTRDFECVFHWADDITQNGRRDIALIRCIARVNIHLIILHTMYLFAEIKRLLNAEFVFVVATFSLRDTYRKPVPNVTAHPYSRLCCRRVTYVHVLNVNVFFQVSSKSNIFPCTFVLNYYPTLLPSAPSFPLHWRHNERRGLSNHWQLHCLFKSLFILTSKKTSNHRVTGLC